MENWFSPQKIKIFDDYLFLGNKYCQNTVSKLHFPVHVGDWFNPKKLDRGVGGCTVVRSIQIFLDVRNCKAP